MARPLRIDIPGGWYHVTTRGNERRVIFRDDADRERLVELVGQLPERFGVRVHGWVWMANHYHLLVETPAANLSRAMQWVQVSYSVWFNHRHRRVGHLFQGRFKAIVVEADQWRWPLSQYLHLNPVRIKELGWDKQVQQRAGQGLGGPPSAALVARRLAVLAAYRWSSYRAYIGREPAPRWLTLAAVLGGSERRRRQAYRQEVEEACRAGQPESPWAALQGGAVLGGATFVEWVQQYLRGDEREQQGLRALRRRPGLATVIGVVEGLKGQKWAEFRDRYGDWGRDLVLYVGRRRCGLRLRELGEAVGGLGYGTVSGAGRRFEARLTRDHKLRRLVRRVIAEIENNQM